MRFSIIIPIYNIEKYIADCIESVLDQSFTDFELLLINDGSTDGSKEICRRYELKDSRIVLINKPNSGVSDARNMGIDNTKGEFILFVDGDDYLVEEALRDLNNHINSVPKFDFLFGRMDVLYDDGVIKTNTKHYPDNIENLNNIEALADIIDKELFIWNVFSHVYKREFIIDNGFKFNGDYIGAEDMDFLLELTIASERINLCNISICRYRMFRIGSYTAKFKLEILINQYKVFKKWFDYFSNNGSITNNSRHILCSFFSNLMIMKTSDMHLINKERVSLIIEFVNNNKYILNYHSTFKNRVISVLYKVLGYINASRLLNIYHKIDIKVLHKNIEF